MPLRLCEVDARLAPLCRQFESETVSIADLDGLAIPVILKENFLNEPEAKLSAVIASDQAFYRLSQRSIFINDSTFWSLPEKVTTAVLAHEVGHAVSHRDGLEARAPFAELSRCQVADLLACRWGFYEALREERAAYYGESYAEALALWPDENAFARAMARWRMQRLAGLKG